MMSAGSARSNSMPARIAALVLCAAMGAPASAQDFTDKMKSWLFGPPAVDNNTWTLKILDASGQPVKDAVLTFPKQSHPSDPWMPDHSHGAVPAKAVNNNDGTYTVAPLYFFMGGIWSTYISAQSGSVTDSTTFTFCVGS